MNGYNAQLDLEQLLFDGGLTSGQVDEAKYRFQSNKYLNESIVDDIVYDSLDSYLNLVKYENRLKVSKDTLSIYDDYLEIAKETENISGEVLQKAQVNAKIHYANNKLDEDNINKLRAVSSFKKDVGIEPEGQICRPNLDTTKVPATLQELLDTVLTTNPLILEQVENIKEQRAILHQKNSNFFPTLKFKAQALYDHDMITDHQNTKIYSARLELSYNIFNGNKDKASSARERKFLDEAQKKLDTVTSEVVDKITAAYNKYNYSLKRIEELESYIRDNKDILAIYKDQFKGGTRTFIDVLNIERDLSAAKQDLIDVQYDLDSSYFDIFKNLGSIEDAVLSSNNDVCMETKVEEEPEPIKQEMTSDEVKEALVDEPEEMRSGTYAVYFVAYRASAKTEKAIEDMRKLVGSDYQMKVEPARGLFSAVIYNLETMDVAKEIRKKAATVYSDAYIRKVK